MATVRMMIELRVKNARRLASGCQICGRILKQGLMLGGPGPTFSELVRTPGMTWPRIREEITARGFMCRSCLNKSTEIKNAGASNPETRTEVELLMDPRVRRTMFERSIYITPEFLDKGVPQIGPEDGDDGDLPPDITEGQARMMVVVT